MALLGITTAVAQLTVYEVVMVWQSVTDMTVAGNGGNPREESNFRAGLSACFSPLLVLKALDSLILKCYYFDMYVLLKATHIICLMVVLLTIGKRRF